MLPAAHRLRASADVAATIRTGRRASAGTLVVHVRQPPTTASVTGPAAATGISAARGGFVVSGKVGNSVVRHRVTRRLRPLLSGHLRVLPPGTDVVVRALPAAATAASSTLAADLSSAMHAAVGGRDRPARRDGERRRPGAEPEPGR